MKILPTRLLGPLFATKRSGMTRARCCTTAREKVLDRRPSRASAPAARPRAGPCRRWSSATHSGRVRRAANAAAPAASCTFFQADAFAGVEVEDDAVGLVEIARHARSRYGTRSRSSARRRPARVAFGTSISASWSGISAGSSCFRPGIFSVLGVLLEEQLAADAARAAHQRARPALQVRQHPVGDAFVVADEVELGQAGATCR